jgi:polyisoprenoid-binding protein YceI
MKRSYLAALVALLALAFVGCSDPADKVHKSAASAPATNQLAAAAPVMGKEYVIRAGDSIIGFVGSKVTGKHDGGFKNFAGTVNVADGKITGSPVIKINMKSIWADNPKLTGHLKSSDFFDVEKFPVSTFTITSIAEVAASKNESTEPSPDNYTITGNLEMHGVTKSISFPAKILMTDELVTVDAEFAINRKDFNINYPGKQNDLIRDDVVLKLAIKATPDAASPKIS